MLDFWKGIGMGTFSIWHWIIVLVVVLVLFGGRGKLSSLMGDAARGITAFKKGLKDEPEDESNNGKTIDSEPKENPSNSKSKDDSQKS